MKMQHIPLGAVLIIHKLVTLDPQQFETKDPKGVTILHVLAHRSHLKTSIDAQLSGAWPILVAFLL